MFADCFPGLISFGDVDGIVEINGNLLLLEWKSCADPIPDAQHIMYKRITKKSAAVRVFVVAGDAESMQINAFCKYEHGKPSAWQKTTLEEIKFQLTMWADWARMVPAS